jgi:hypothetical protein
MKCNFSDGCDQTVQKKRKGAGGANMCPAHLTKYKTDLQRKSRAKKKEEKAKPFDLLISMPTEISEHMYRFLDGKDCANYLSAFKPCTTTAPILLRKRNVEVCNRLVEYQQQARRLGDEVHEYEFIGNKIQDGAMWYCIHFIGHPLQVDGNTRWIEADDPEIQGEMLDEYRQLHGL